ncbi:MAG: hypothetical protein KDD53_00975 [Bdellovibrionales bacterium]|nr:hypothetical protein [Bdellovibrionales bacterium]
MALPKLSSLTASYNQLNAKSFLVQDLKRAQAETITQGCRGIFKIANDGESYSFGCDYLSYDVTDPPSADVVSFVRNLPEDITVESDIPIIFNSQGRAVDIDGILTNVSVTFEESSSGSPESFASGVLLGTGVFSYD